MRRLIAESLAQELRERNYLVQTKWKCSILPITSRIGFPSDLLMIRASKHGSLNSVELYEDEIVLGLHKLHGAIGSVVRLAYCTPNLIEAICQHLPEPQ